MLPGLLCSFVFSSAVSHQALHLLPQLQTLKQIEHKIMQDCVNEGLLLYNKSPLMPQEQRKLPYIESEHWSI